MAFGGGGTEGEEAGPRVLGYGTGGLCSAGLATSSGRCGLPLGHSVLDPWPTSQRDEQSLEMAPRTPTRSRIPFRLAFQATPAPPLCRNRKHTLNVAGSGQCRDA